jgi:hypothetical protein
MDADVMITIALCLEVFLFALVGGLFVAHEVHKSRSRAAVETWSPASAAGPSRRRKQSNDRSRPIDRGLRTKETTS